MSDDIAIKVENVSKTFRLPHEKNRSLKGTFINFYRSRQTYEKQQALKDVSFEVKKGEFFGIVGRNGSGKSTLLKMLAGIYSPSRGSIQVNGKLTPFIELGVGFNPELTGRENVFLNGALLGFNRKEMNALYKDIVEFAELERFMDQKLKNYSSGMQVRLAFSIAIRAQSDILLLDEVLAVGDYDFQQKCFEYFKHLKKIKKTVVLVSHDMNNIRQFCTSAIHIESGEIIAQGSLSSVVDSYNKENMKRALKVDERDEKDEKAQAVYGNGDAVIEEVYTEDAAGKIKKLFSPNENFTVCFRIKAKKQLETPVFGMIFADTSGKVIFATNTLDQKIKTDTLKKGQTVTVKYKLANVYDDGVYEVSGAIADKDRVTIYGRVESAHTFRLMGREVTARAPFYPGHEIVFIQKS